MPKSLTDGQQRLVFGILVVVLVAFGIYLSLGGFGGGNEDDQGVDQQAQEGVDQQAQESDRNDGTQQLATTPPSPLPTTAAEDMKVFDWLPFTEAEAKAAATTAQGFAEAYGTIDYSKPPEEYYTSLEELATEDYAKSLAKSSGASALREEMQKEKAVATGRAQVKSIRSFDEESIVFIVKAQSITEGSDDGAESELGDFAVTVVKEDGSWRVFDFQPADAGNLGENQ